MSGWCNGSAGPTYLWAQAYLLLDEPRYLSLAEKATWNTWQDPAPVWNLCCGLVGRSYGLLHFYKLVRDETWLSGPASWPIGRLSMPAHRRWRNTSG